MSIYPLNCPPPDAEKIVDNIYVFVKNNPPLPVDFQTAYEKGRFADGDLCLRHALSCGRNIHYLQSIEKLFPIKRGFLKAKATLQSSDGLIKQTTDNILHHSFWVDPSLKANLYTKFEVM